MATTDELIEYFFAHRYEYVKKYPRKWIVLCNYKVVAVRNSYQEGCRYAEEFCKPDNYIVEFLLPGAEAPVVYHLGLRTPPLNKRE